jgi:hypothetical protein
VLTRSQTKETEERRKKKEERRKKKEESGDMILSCETV